MDWRIIGRSHQLIWRREILGGEGEKYLEEKERNTWRGRREILGGEGGENSFSTRKRRQFQDQWGDPVWCTKTYFNEYIGDIFCYMLLFIYQCISIYIDLCHCTRKYIYLRGSKSTLCLWCSCKSLSLRKRWSVFPFFLKSLFTSADYIAILQAPSYISKGLCSF